MEGPTPGEETADAVDPQLGLPLPAQRVLGRMVVKLNWRYFLRRQIDVNLRTAHRLDAIEDALTRTQNDVRAVADRTHEATSAIHDLHSAHDHSIAVVVQQMHSAVGLLRRELARFHVELIQQQTITTQMSAELGQTTERVSTELSAASDRMNRYLDDHQESLAKVESDLDDVRHGLGDALASASWRYAQVDQFLASARAAQPRLPNRDDVEAVPTSADVLELATVAVVEGEVEHSRGVHAADLKVVRDVTAGGVDGAVLDLRCGRGDWLRLMKESGVAATGIDSNPLVVQRLGEIGLPATCADPLEELARCARGSVAVISAFWFLERLNTDELVRFVDVSVHALARDGALLVLSPDPRAPVGMARYFRDPTAVRPVHPETLATLLQSAGFRAVELSDADASDPRSAFRVVARR